MSGLGRGPVRVGPLMLPGEGGVYGVWLASLAYGLVNMSFRSPLVASSALTGSLLSLLLLERARQGSLLPIILVALSYIPAVKAGLPSSILLVSAALALLPAALSGRGVKGVIAGGVLISIHGGFLWSLGSPWDLVGVLAPMVYSLLTISHAAAVVVRRVDVVLPEVLAAYAAVGSLILAWWLGGAHAKALILALDVLVRGALLHSGAYYRVSRRAYGFHEVAHSLAVILALALA